jgi:uncharacterized protein DUF4381
MKPNALERLHDFYQPQPPSWMPQTVGWYVVLALVVLLLAWGGWRLVAHWRRNRYRREALRELEHAAPSAIPALMKRTALAAWPREQVASLSGERWLRFLEAHDGKDSFSKPPANLLVDLDYRETSLAPEEERAIRRLAGDWIRRHRVRA